MKKENRFVYVGPSEIIPPYYGSVFDAKYVGKSLSSGVPLKYFIEVEGEDLDKVCSLYELFEKEFTKEFYKKQGRITKEGTAKISEKIGLKAFVDSLVK